MADFNSTNAVTVGGATKKDHYDRSFNNGIANKDARSQLQLGGEEDFQQTNASETEIKSSEHAEVDGSNLGGHIVEFHFMGKVDAGTGIVRLYNVTDAGAVASSSTNVTATSPTLHKSSALTLAAGEKVYRADAQRGTTWIAVWGAKIVIS